MEMSPVTIATAYVLLGLAKPKETFQYSSVNWKLLKMNKLWKFSFLCKMVTTKNEQTVEIFFHYGGIRFSSPKHPPLTQTQYTQSTSINENKIKYSIYFYSAVFCNLVHRCSQVHGHPHLKSEVS